MRILTKDNDWGAGSPPPSPPLPTDNNSQRGFSYPSSSTQIQFAAQNHTLQCWLLFGDLHQQDNTKLPFTVQHKSKLFFGGDHTGITLPRGFSPGAARIYARAPPRGWKGETLETPARICRLKMETSEVDTHTGYTGYTSSYLQVRSGNK